MCEFVSDAWTGNALLVHLTDYAWLYPTPKSSAISISQDWVLTHGTMLESTILESEEISKFIENMVPGQLTSVPEELAEELEFSVVRQLKTGYQNHIGKVTFAWLCPLIMHTFKTFFDTWNFHDCEISKSVQLRRMLFLLIRVNSRHSFKMSGEQALQCLQEQILPLSFTRGTPVEIISSPFGNVWFMNSIARGIVSNVIGGIIMLDTYVFPNSEGSPVYITSPDSESRNLIGMVIVSMVWCRNEWVQYTFAANLAPCLTVLQQSFPTPYTKFAIRHDNQTVLDKSVVIIACGDKRGTGILVDKDTGIFLTCAHVVEQAPQTQISVIVFRVSKDNPYLNMTAELLFRSPKNIPYDVAVLKVKPSELDPSLEPIQFSDAPIMPGEPVVAVGFAFMLSTWPTMTSGVVSKSLDYMLITTCCIQGGFSGGPIISQTTGKMLGMVVSNIQTACNNVRIQRISLSVPVFVLRKPLQKYLRTDDIHVMQDFVNNDPIVRKIWDMDVGVNLSAKL
ncbi:peroxisomal leader peptide-processing protease [Odontomachus brunneus]|uniref:peroxisomal leader peptide-processing protease n=1 Tax=Odontomachus brunneus TaxID=486640 RepID=UPI0013F1D949|nr:peroxisomal leader peptide-processing protease [Odontomachus brunneus]XP_032667621.1 peroxisomal leader peptide-processing protease [Odontomachus brunneus]XP_032667622.1 peroxisomal leader peptide-processing protease [Odontomachus brunneus]